MMLMGGWVGVLVVFLGVLGRLEGILFSSDKAKSILEKHNEIRKGEPASNMKKLRWNGVLARMASEWAELCQSEHGQPKALDKPYRFTGQNMNIFSRRQEDYTVSINAWIDEKKFYDFDAMTCQSGEKCGHYRQLTWANTEELGCGYSKCTFIAGLELNYGDIFVCNYGPSGNIRGVQPYKVGESCTECEEDYKCENDLCVSTTALTGDSTPEDTKEDSDVIGFDYSKIPDEFDI